MSTTTKKSKFAFLLPISALTKTTQRFPLCVLCCLLFFIPSVMYTHDATSFLTRPMLENIIKYTTLGFFWFGSMRLLAEGLKLSRVIELASAIALFAIFIAATELPGNGLPRVTFFTLIISLALSTTWTGFASSNKPLAFWLFNKTLWLGASLSLLVGLIWYGGACLLLQSLKILFDVKISSEVWFDLGLFTGAILTPLYTLSWIKTPQECLQKTEEGSTIPPQLHIAINWILLPLVLAYLAILYAYFGKIAIEATLPNGWLSFVILGFSGVGLLTYLVAYPVRETAKSSALVRLFYKGFFPALILPIGMLCYCIYLRIAQYGLTEERYFVALTALWLTLITLLYFTKRLQLKHIAMLASVLLCLSAFGPWRATSLSINSQYHRLTALLEQKNILVGGVIQKSAYLSFEERKNISSMLNYLTGKSQGNELLSRLFPDIYAQKCKAAKDFSDCTVELPSLTHAMGFEFVSRYDKRASATRHVVTFKNTDTGFTPLSVFSAFSKFAFLGPSTTEYNGHAITWDGKPDDLRITIHFEDQDIVLMRTDKQGKAQDIARLDLKDYIKTEGSRLIAPNQAPLILPFQVDNTPYGLVITQVSIEATDNKNLMDFSITTATIPFLLH